MKIINNTNKELVFYVGDAHREEPEAVVTLKVGEDFNLDTCPQEDIVIQDKQKMLITNTTKFKLRFSVMKSKSENEDYEAFAYVIAPGCGLSIPGDNYLVSIEPELEQKMDKEIKKEMDEWVRLINAKLDNLQKAIGLRFDNLKKVVGDYLELSSNLSIASVKANLKNV